MKVVEIDYMDLQGQRFNGYNLHQSLREKGIHASQLVAWKLSDTDTVYSYAEDSVLDAQIRVLEERYSIHNLLFPYAEELMKLEVFQNADIAHYHLIHKGAFSLLDFPELIHQKKSVWTIHDPWIVTGGCIHPLECEGWKDGCLKCKRKDTIYSRMKEENTAFMWNTKKDILSRVNPDIVVASSFMKKYIQESPITRHFNKIHTIPFGVDIRQYKPWEQKQNREKLGIPVDSFVVAFRCDEAEIKGCRYLYEALRLIGRDADIVLLCVGAGKVPEDIRENYQTYSFGWVVNEQRITEFLVASDLFIMPSLAESFGLMAIESMAAGSPVVCFENTVISEITEAPDCGISVTYGSSKEIAEQIMFLKENRKYLQERGRKGHELVKEKYRFEDYVDKHLKLYESIVYK